MYFCLKLSDNDGNTYTCSLIMKDPYAAITHVRHAAHRYAEQWCRDADYADNGEVVDVTWSLMDKTTGYELDNGCLTVTLPPRHQRLIAAATRGHEKTCGNNPEDHTWTSEGEGGSPDSPGVWLTGGTSVKFAFHCRVCGLRRTVQITGPPSSPGAGDTVEYKMLDEVAINAHRRDGTMDPGATAGGKMFKVMTRDGIVHSTFCVLSDAVDQADLIHGFVDFAGMKIRSSDSEDQSTGVITSIDGTTATVQWDTGITESCDTSDLIVA